MNVAVITCSNRSAAGTRPDTSGQLLATLLTDAGFADQAWWTDPDDRFALVLAAAV